MLYYAGGIASLGGQLDKQVLGHLYQYLELVLRWAAIRETYDSAVGVAAAACPGGDNLEERQRLVVLQTWFPQNSKIYSMWVQVQRQ